MANILIVTNTASGISDGAQAVGNILDGQGHTVTVRDDGVAVDSTGFDLVVLWDGSFNAGWAVEAVPIVASDNDVATALGMASASSVGTGQTAINVIDDGHPIAVAAGLEAGLNTVSSGSNACRLNPGTAAPGVAKIARDSTGTDDRIVLAAIDQGGLLVDGETPAPARRVFFGQNHAQNWTQLGEDLFLACCDWAMKSGGGDETAPTLSNATATSTGSTTASGSVDTDEAGTVYAVITESATPPEDGEDIVGESVAGGVAYDSAVASEPDTVNFAFAGLDPATTYWMHVVATDAADNMSDIESSSSFQTDAEVVQSEAVAFLEDESLAGTTAATHIAGTVTQGGTPVEGLAVIALNRTTDTATIAQTDAQGRYVFAGLAPGESYMVIPEVHEDTGTFYRANPAIRTPSVNGD